MSQQEFYETVQRQQEWEEQMSKHTPGPWKVASSWEDYTVEGPSGEEIIFQDGPYGTPTIKEANARLIAAAPDLLEALNAMLGSIHPYREDGTPTIPEATIEIVNAAIEKATGDVK